MESTNVRSLSTAWLLGFTARGRFAQRYEHRDALHENIVLGNDANLRGFRQTCSKGVYNLTITSLSVAVALVIGTIELVGVLADRLHVDSGPLADIASINLDYAGTSSWAYSWCPGSSPSPSGSSAESNNVGQPTN